MKIYIETLGCPKNMNDSEVAAGLLEKEGYEVVNGLENADIVMVNTCGFINDAKKESIHKIFELSENKGEEAWLVVTGCLSQRYGEDLYKEMPEVDLFLGVNDYERLPDLLRNLKREKRQKVLSYSGTEYREIAPRKRLSGNYSATIKISEGCDNLCAYCVIPSIRGGYRSRKMESIVEEAEKLSDQGCKELIIIAQDVTTYGLDLYGHLALPELLKKLCRIQELQWIRLMYCYEDRITEELIQVIKEEEKICNYLDIPLQHFSDKILQGMNRRSTSKSIGNTLERLRREIPDIHIRTTFITGFPGETKEDFDLLYDFVEEQQFNRMGVFTYSKEEGTPAADRKDQVRKDVKEKRKDSLMRLQQEISLSLNQKKIGEILDVLVEEIDEDGSYIGRSPYDAPEIDNAVLFTSNLDRVPGDTVKVRIEDAFDYDLVGVEV